MLQKGVIRLEIIMAIALFNSRKRLEGKQPFSQALSFSKLIQSRNDPTDPGRKPYMGIESLGRTSGIVSPVRTPNMGMESPGRMIA